MLLCLVSLSAKSFDCTAASHNVIHDIWISHGEMIVRRVDIYIPAGYENDSLPALFLLAGINGYEGSWQDLASVIDTLDKQIAEGKCQPMMLVMPDNNKWPIKTRPITHGNLWKCVTHYSLLSREHDLELAISDLIDKLDTTYRITSCAIAGLSDGGRMAANAANVRPDRLRTVGLFSPVLFKDQLPKDKTQTYFVYVGTSDMFYQNGKRFHKRLEKEYYPHYYFEKKKGHHTWPMWRWCISDFLGRLTPPYFVNTRATQPVHQEL